MKITAIEIHDFKRLYDVELRPSADTFVILLGGDNAQGKTSILDALTAAFGGGRALPADPIRHGADRAEIRIELDGGAMIVRRKITADGETLELRGADGAELRRPQELLNTIVGRSFLDPFEFLSKKEPEQRAELLKVIPNADAIVDLDAQRKALFDTRTTVNRELKKAEGELARTPAVDLVDEIDVDAIYREIGELQAAGLKHEQARSKLQAARVRHEGCEEQIRRLERELAAAQAARAQAAVEIQNAEAALTTDVEADARAMAIAALQERGRAAAADNRRAGETRLAHERRAKVKSETEQLRVRSDKLTAAIEQIDVDRAGELAAAKLPIEGLGFNDLGVTYKGVPLAQASGSERMRVALMLAIVTRPKLRDVWIKDGALLDKQSLADVVAQARSADCRVWIERVGDSDPGAILVSDGKIVKGKKS